MGFAMGGGFVLSGACHKTIGWRMNIPSILSVVFGVLVTNVIKTPIVYNYKSAETGLSPLLTIPKPAQGLFAMNVMGHRGGTTKYTLAQWKVKTHKTDNLFRFVDAVQHKLPVRCRKKRNHV